MVCFRQKCNAHFGSINPGNLLIRECFNMIIRHLRDSRLSPRVALDMITSGLEQRGASVLSLEVIKRLQNPEYRSRTSDILRKHQFICTSGKIILTRIHSMDATCLSVCLSVHPSVYPRAIFRTKQNIQRYVI